MSSVNGVNGIKLDTLAERQQAFAELSELRHAIAVRTNQTKTATPQERRLFEALGVACRALRECLFRSGS